MGARDLEAACSAVPHFYTLTTISCRNLRLICSWGGAWRPGSITVSLGLEVVQPTCHEAAGLGLLCKGWQWKARGDHITGQWPLWPGHSTQAGQPGDSSSCWQSQWSPGKCERAGQVQVESMKFSEQKLQDIGLGTCLPAMQLRKGLQAKAGAETPAAMLASVHRCVS